MPSFARNLFEKGLLALPGMRGSSLKGPVRMAKKMARGASLPPADRFIMDSTYLNTHQKSALYTSELLSALYESDPAIRHRASFERVQHADFLNQMLYLDSKIFMASLNLTYNDKMSMASSVEVRVPFLDRELAEFVAWNVPPHLKLKGFLRPTTKYIFREAMKGILPEEVLCQPKAGFAAPVDYWLANDLRPMVDDLLSESQVRSRGLLRPGSVNKFVKENRHSPHRLVYANLAVPYSGTLDANLP